MPTTSQRQFHLSLNVSDLQRSVGFYRILFGGEPAKQRADYAKFELQDPPVVLSLEPHPADGQGALNHMGLRLPDSATLAEMQRRLELAGLSSEREQGVECCYSRQTKFWLHDPDGNLWEFYVLEGDIDHRGAGQLLEQVAPPDAPPTSRKAAASSTEKTAEWEHRLGEPFPNRLPFTEDSLEEVRLRGTFNMTGADADSVLSEVRRALGPEARVLIHCLTAAEPPAGDVSLPGPAAMVKQVPTDRELIGALEAEGFIGIELTKFGGAACFHAGGTEMRETMLRAVKPAAADSTEAADSHVVMYRGPFREVTDDAGRTWRRGERQRVPAGVWNMLQGQAFAEHFTCLSAPAAEPVACTAGNGN